MQYIIAATDSVFKTSGICSTTGMLILSENSNRGNFCTSQKGEKKTIESSFVIPIWESFVLRFVTDHY